MAKPNTVELLFEGRTTRPIAAGDQVAVFKDTDGLVFVEPSAIFHRNEQHVAAGWGGGRILFLDVDGVLNNEGSFRQGQGGAPLEPRCIMLIRNVLAETGARLVLSSSWRHMEGHRDKVFGEFAGFWHTEEPTTEVFEKDVNGLIRGRRRGHEIHAWLDRHPDVKTYAVIDDEDDAISAMHKNFVQTSFRMGVTRAAADELVRLLKGGGDG